MNEQVTNILSQNGTKTSKIQQLLNLGLTRRQVADLITNGNYGFVQNVYKKMLQAGTLATAPATETGQIDYTFNRRFGVEIEAYNCSPERLERELREAGIAIEIERYNHTTRGHWKITTDASLTGNQTFELVSPILQGEAGLAELEKVCWVLEYCNVKVNDSCGLHVHMDAAAFTLQTWKNLAICYKRLERVIDGFQPDSRRNNRYCKSLRTISEARINQANNIAELQYAFGRDRYHKLNLESYSRHNTVEFRQHSGTTSFTKMEKWIHFLSNMITFAEHHEPISSTCRLMDIPFMSDNDKVFFKLRTKKLA